MKNKSTRHKESNTFKFQPFSERIGYVDVDIFHLVVHEYEAVTDENECFFYQCIQKWNTLNLTEGYAAFKKEIHPNEVITLAQLILNKEQVIQILFKHLQNRDILYLQPLLELVVALAKDLRQYFYEYYPDLLQILIDLLNKKDVEQLEWTFTCLAFLFKFLWRPLTKDINVVFKNLLPLLSDDKPAYINNFAAESFAFVARKVKDKSAFLKLILKSVKSTHDGITGCGKLLFEVINGIDGQFHSCATSVLPFYLNALLDKNLSQKIYFKIVEQIVANILINIQPQRCDLLWQNYILLLTKLRELWNSEIEDVEKNIQSVLKLIKQTLEYRNGKFLHSSGVLVEEILEIMSLSNLSKPLIFTIIEIVALLLLLKEIGITQEQASSLITKSLSVSNQNVLIHFVEIVCKCSLFEALILPKFLKECVNSSLNLEFFSTLSKIVLTKSSLALGGINFNLWKKYPLIASNDDNLKMQHIFMDCLNIDTVEEMFGNFTKYMYVLICLPHIYLTDEKTVTRKLQKLINLICYSIKSKEGEIPNNVLKQELFLLLNTLECVFHINGNIISEDVDLIVDTVLPFTTNQEFITSLKILDLYLTKFKDDNGIITWTLLLKLHKILERNCSSPYHEVRLLTTHIYSLFEYIEQIAELSTSNEEWKIFSSCYNVELIPTQVQTFRDQLKLLEKFDFQKSQMKMCQDTEFKTLPLTYLCGTLYINFQLLWEPITKLIASHAHGLNIDIFWKTFSDELKGVVVNIKAISEPNVDTFDNNCNVIKELYEATYKMESKPDFLNYRFLLWKAMLLFADIAEARTRDVSNLFLQFMEEEYTKSSAEIALIWNIKQNLDVAENARAEVINSNSTFSKEPKASMTTSPKKMNLRTLLQILSVFSKVKSPQSMYREQELYKIYLDLLAYKNSAVQKAALDCIMTYKPKYLIPYKDHLYNLINESNFKNELATFRIDTDSSILQNEHRMDLIPLVFKIVYSKMFMKTGLRTGGKSSSQLRRNLVLKFIAGCTKEEMLHFVKMSFRYYIPHMQDDSEAMVAIIYKNFDLEKFIPPKRLQSTINLVNIVLDRFGGLMDIDTQRFLLKILFIVGAFLKSAYSQNSQVHAGYLPILRNIRVLCINILEKYFESFENFPWTIEEINVIYNNFVWPYLDKLNVEGIYSPTALLKLFIQWSSNPKYFPLLIKYQEDDASCYPLMHIMKLYLNDKCHFSVINSITGIIEKLLTLKIDEDVSNKNILAENVLPIPEDIINQLTVKELNYGSCILLQHIPTILEKFRKKLVKIKTINKTDMFIMSRVSELIYETKTCNAILELLLPITLRKCRIGANEETLLHLVTILHNLLQKMDEPQKLLRQLSPLFGDVKFVSARKIMCQILHIIATKCDSFKTTALLMQQLNAYDLKWIDQPDFQIRQDAFKEVQLLIDSKMISLEMGILLMYNCYYFIQENDLALRDNAIYCLQSLAPTLISIHGHSQEVKTYIVDATLLNLLRSGMGNKNNDVRNECILLLGYFARECPAAHIILSDLHKLTNKNDLEVDFFENLTHLQLHRQTRALLKFCEVIKTETVKPTVRTLTQFVLPLVSTYLCSEKYASKNSLVDAAVEAIGVVCQILPWHQYENVLKYYLNKLQHKNEYQKQLVKLLVRILNAFHFDLSKAYVTDESTTIINTEEAESLINNENETEIIIEQQLQDILDDFPEQDVGAELNGAQCNENEKINILCKSTANRVLHTIQIVLLPQLQKVLAELTQYETSHKVNRKHINTEDDDLLKLPISLAVVKLLQKLPKAILEANLNRVLTKLCTFLKSQLESVRRMARETLQKIMISLGPEYLNFLLGIMTSLLSKGFQVHVLVYTAHAVLSSLKMLYKRNDIDKVLLTVTDLCKADLFGYVADEKEIYKIGRKTSEAKSTKSFDTLQILGQYVTDKSLVDLLMPIKDVLTSSHSFKIINKCQECLKHIALGLIDNQFVEIESLLKFAYGISVQSTSELLTSKEPPNQENETARLEKSKQDCFIIPAAPSGRLGAKNKIMKSSMKTNIHVLTEFGLRVCYFLLKRDKLRNDMYKPYLDPFIIVFKDCLSSQHVKLSTLALQCFTWSLKYELPSLEKNIEEIVKLIFEILHKYGSAGASKGDNFELIMTAFKTTATLMRDVKYYTIDSERLKILLLYAEQDLYDHDRQATAFVLIKAIISRKLVLPEIYEIVMKVAELSITSELPNTRLQARITFQHFIMDYPLGKKLEKYIAFYVSQLNYELQTGRESAIDMIQNLINAFPLSILKQSSGMLFVTLGARLINDDVPSCRKMVATCLTVMLKRLTKADRDPLFDIIILWLHEKKINHQRLAAQLCGILVSVEKTTFESRIAILVPEILIQFGIGNENHTPGRFVSLKQNSILENSSELDRSKDHHLFQVLQLLLKLCLHCPSFLNQTDDLDNLSVYIQNLLTYPHEWVRLSAAQVLGFVLSSLDVNHLEDLLISNKKEESGYLYSDPMNNVKSLTLDLCAQLQPGIANNEFGEQIIKNLVFIARVIQNVPFDKTDVKVNLLWLTKRMRKIVNTEIVETPSITTLRHEVFKWIAGIVLALEERNVSKVLYHLLAPLVREIATVEENNSSLRHLAKEVSKLIKKKIGLEKYAETILLLEKHISNKKGVRKRERNQLAITNPELHAKKKIKNHEKKKETKKRKHEENKGVKRKIKRRKIDLDRE